MSHDDVGTWPAEPAVAARPARAGHLQLAARHLRLAGLPRQQQQHQPQLPRRPPPHRRRPRRPPWTHLRGPPAHLGGPPAAMPRSRWAGAGRGSSQSSGNDAMPPDRPRADPTRSRRGVRSTRRRAWPSILWRLVRGLPPPPSGSGSGDLPPPPPETNPGRSPGFSRARDRPSRQLNRPTGPPALKARAGRHPLWSPPRRNQSQPPSG